MPYGFDINDHQIHIENLRYPWEEYPGCIPFIYAGAFLPKSDLFIKLLFKALENLKSKRELKTEIKLFFIGTGNYFHKSISEYARENNIDDHIIEIRDRFPFLDVLNFLSAAKGVLLIGSTEEHYTASKTFQTILSKRPVFSMLHYMSSAVQIFKECKAASYLCEYNPNQAIEDFSKKTEQTFLDFIRGNRVYEPDLNQMEKYSAKQSAKSLVEAIEKIKC
jgi:hypothetical protein